MFIYIKIDGECNETTPVISVDGFHVNFNILTTLVPELCIYSSSNNIKSEVRKESTTDMESATFETLKTTVTFLVSIFYTLEKT